MNNYWGARPDGSFIVGGSGSYRDKRELWERNFDDASLIESALPFAEQWAGKNLVGWEDAEMKIENAWTGIMGVSIAFSSFPPPSFLSSLFTLSLIFCHPFLNLTQNEAVVAVRATTGTHATQSRDTVSLGPNG